MREHQAGGDAVAVRLLVHGRVQGVGFRYHVARAAEQLALRGFVRNLPGGEVEVVAEGPPSALEALERAVGEGPRWSRVDRVEREDREVTGSHAGFDIRY